MLSPTFSLFHHRYWIVNDILHMYHNWNSVGRCTFSGVLILWCRIFVRLLNRSGICWPIIMDQVVSKKSSNISNQKIHVTVLCEDLIIHSCNSGIGCVHKWKYFTLTLVSWFHKGSSTLSGIKLKRDLITLNHQSVKIKFTASRIINKFCSNLVAPVTVLKDCTLNHETIKSSGALCLNIFTQNWKLYSFFTSNFLNINILIAEFTLSYHQHFIPPFFFSETSLIENNYS